MKIVFMGTPEFARLPLACLAESKHTVLAVVTGQDKQSGRGRKLVSTPCKVEADTRAIPVFTPKTLKSSKLRASLAELNADLFVVIAFRILPESLYSLPKSGSINIHGSLLPKYRGAAPINWALINGERKTGLTSFYLKEKVDTGDMILQESWPIDEADSYDSMSSRLSAEAGPFLLRSLEAIENGKQEKISQDESLATPARKLKPEDGLIEFDRPARRAHDQIRGMTSRPGAFSFYRGKKVKLIQARVATDIESGQAEPGTLLPHRKRLLVQCQGSVLELLRLLPEGRKEMDSISFINGNRPQPGDKLSA